jgi:acyl-CoA synthetase (NDP forming)
MNEINTLDKMSWPQTVSIVGTSPVHGNRHNSVVRAVLKHRFQESLYPVSPTNACLKAYKSVADLPEVADMALMIKPLPDCFAGETMEAQMRRVFRDAGVLLSAEPSITMYVLSLIYQCKRIQALPVINERSSCKSTADINALASTAVRFSNQFLTAPDVKEFEINSMIVGAKSHGLRAVDALVIADSPLTGLQQFQATSKGEQYVL